MPVDQRTRDLWDAVNRYVQEHAGAITSIPHLFPMRLECAPISPLPKLLSDNGYRVTRLDERTERIDPVGHIVVHAAERSSMPALRTVAHAAFVTVDSYSVWPGRST